MVSVLIPACDAAVTLATSLRSVARQTWRSFECIVVDDGSRDDTAAIAAHFARHDPRFLLVRQPHGGVVAALNAGLLHCRGEYIARMDADDVMRRERLAAQVALLEAQPELAAVGCHVRLFPRASLGAGWRQYERWLNGILTPEQLRRDALVECPVAHPGLMLRRRVLAELGYREMGWPEDYDLVLRLLEIGAAIGIVPRRLLAWRSSSERASRTDPRCAIDRFVACKADYLARTFLADRSGFGLWGYGSTGRAIRRELRGHGKNATYVIDVDRARIGNDLRWEKGSAPVPVLPPDSVDRLRTPPPLLVSVAGERPRNEIRDFLADRGWQELRDFVCVA
ncbi:MAG TPA: glycosyltransferase family 2 protein [Terriglobales bacterium]|nr:glycosyltransferase family 2 protein [Terriglobales bacterium]